VQALRVRLVHAAGRRGAEADVIFLLDLALTRLWRAAQRRRYWRLSARLFDLRVRLESLATGLRVPGARS
jgi:hypothetical protein